VSDEESDLINRYARRPGLGKDQRYSAFNPANLLAIHQRERVVLQALGAVGIRDLSGLRVLDVGCGAGSGFLRFMLMGAKPANLFGIDLLPERVDAARQCHPSITVVQGNAVSLPWPHSSFDLISQFTVFSSILSADVRARTAAEMIRVLRVGGHIIWYDFWLNPTNSDTRGIPGKEIRRLFPDFVIRLRRLTLAPPIARYLAPRSWLAGCFLQEVRPLQSHYFALLTKQA
jgi:ubiquinone/menaquinone biosynthesis C-methylase UbiE